MILKATMVQVGMKYAASNAPLNELIRQFVDIVASRCSAALQSEAAVWRELTRLDCDRQFKPFVYLNGRGSRTGTGDRHAPCWEGTA
jgi:hypothetical protein